jgi:group II intron reverse transcriptase/maturase
MDYITDVRNILLAYRNIKNNKGSKTAGTDNKNIEHLKCLKKDEFIALIQNKFSNYTPKSVRREEIPKPDGSLRPLGIPCIDDRIIQQCIKQVLEPICEAKFHKHSYGFRPNRSTSHAIARCMFLMNITKLHYVVDIDIKGFFDNVNHSNLKKQLWEIGITDKNLLSILSKILNS